MSRTPTRPSERIAGLPLDQRGGRHFVAVCLGLSILSIALAPLLMPDTYSWVENTTSESAAQGLPGAWLARIGFVLFGLAVLSLATLVSSWSRMARVFHLLFGVSMAATAVFSTRSFESGATFDRTEDLLHSVAATTMGFAFALGVLMVAMRRRPRSGPRMSLDFVALAASIGIPLLMMVDPVSAGLWQRLMFVVAYVWYGGEALSSSAPESTAAGVGLRLKILRMRG